MPKSLGQTLRELREERGLSRNQVAVRARGGVSADYLRKVELGERTPSARVLKVLAQTYGVDAVYLMKLAEYVPESTVAEEPARYEPPHPIDTWTKLRAAIMEDPNLDVEVKRGLLQSIKTTVTPYLQEAAEKKGGVEERRAPRRSAS